MLIPIEGMLACILVAVQAPPLPIDPPADERNLALGRPCSFAPQPNCADTAPGDQADLTDGKISARKDFKIWSDPASVGWEYTPRINIGVDLGSLSSISEISARFLGGSAQPSLDFPTYVTAVASVDGQHWFQVANYDSHRWTDEVEFGVPQNIGTAWVHALRFKGLSLRARHVGLIVGGTGLTCSDEMWVFGKPAVGEESITGPAVAFSTTSPQVAGLRDAATLAKGLVLPQQLLLLDESNQGRDAQLTVEITPGVSFRGLEFREELVKPFDIERQPDGSTRVSAKVALSGHSSLPWMTLLLEGGPGLSTHDSIRLSLRWSGGQSETVQWAVKPVQFETPPTARRMMFALAWWRQKRANNWPGFLGVMRHVGINTVSTLEDYIRADDQSQLDGLSKARDLGFRILNVFSTFHGIVSQHESDPEVYCQGPTGPIGKQLCPSYRGKWYRAELDRVALNTALLKPDFISMDIEVWNWAGPKDSEQCTRCIADRRKLGLESWAQWRSDKAFEMWSDVERRIQAASKAVGGPRVALGSYDFRPGQTYQQFWPVDRLLQAGLMQSTQCSVYTPLRPAQIADAGDQARQDRARVTRTCGMPWATPGDTGTLNSDQMRCGLLEYFVNGSCGIHFWSDRYWDGETLFGLHQAIRAVTPVEDIIVDGRLSNRASVSASGDRVSAMESEKGLAVLVARYAPTSDEPIELRVDLPWDAEAADCETGERIGAFAKGVQIASVHLGPKRSRLLGFRKLVADRTPPPTP